MCDQCFENSKVTDSRYKAETRIGVSNTISRRRECFLCGERFTTYEIDADLLSELLDDSTPDFST
jgi:transcriptional regulator NrdR family protein